MLEYWTPELLSAALSLLPDKSRLALELAATGDTTIKTVREYGFADNTHYELTLETARTFLLRHFASMGVSKINDLQFPPIGTSSDNAMIVRHRADKIFRPRKTAGRKLKKPIEPPVELPVKPFGPKKKLGRPSKASKAGV